jgi:hypothetical protein
VNAKEMFEKLDYYPFDDEYHGCSTITYLNDDGGYFHKIKFINFRKIVRIEEYETYNEDTPQGVVDVDIELHQAITQQMKELGWLGE